MNYSLGNMLSNGGALNPDGLALDLQFATDKTLTARKGPTPTFTRASTATFVGSNGLIQSAAIDAPRFDHDPVTLASRGLLIEESRANLLLHNRNLTNAAWTVTNVTASQNQTGIDGVSSSASLINATSANGTILQAITSTSAARATSAYVKRVTGSGVIEMTQNGGTTWTSITVTSDWTRVSLASATVTNPSVGFRIVTSGDEIAVDGVQLENGSFVTSVIFTTTTALTRSADVCSYSAVSGFYNPAAGTLVGDLILYTPSPSPSPELFRFGSGNNRIQLGTTNVAGQAIRPFIISGGVTTYDSTQGTTVAGVRRKVALAFATNDAISCLNGTLGTQDTSVTIPVSISTATIGASAFTSHIASIRYFNKRLINAKLQSLTT
jgi:hypothetical protein